MTDLVQEPALGFKYQVVLDKDARRHLVFETFVPRDADISQLNSLIDKIGSAADRQAAKYELEQAQIALEGHLQKIAGLEAQLAMMEETYSARWEADVEAGRRKGAFSLDKLPPSELSAKKNVEQSLERYREGARAYQEDIKRLQPVVNGHGSNGSADSHTGMSGR